MPLVIRRLNLAALPCCSIQERERLPHSPVVYIIFTDSEILYVGATKSLKNRWEGLLQDWRFRKAFKRNKNTKVSWINAEIGCFSDFETALITFLNPKLNIIRSGRTYHHERNKK